MALRSNILSLLLILCLAPIRVAHAQSELTSIGVVLPLSGDSAFWGTSSRNAMQLALEDIEKRADLQSKKIRLIFEDDRCDTKTAVSAYKRLTAMEGVDIVFGAVCSSSTMAMAALAEREKVLLLSPCSESAQISQAGDYIFRTWAPNGRQGVAMAHYVREKLGLERVAMLVVMNDFGSSLASAFKGEFAALGGEVVGQEDYPAADNDHRSRLLRLRSKNPQAIYIVSYIADGVIAVRQYRELAAELPLLGTSTMNSPDFIKPLGAMAEGIVISDLADSTTAEFRSRYEKAFHVNWPGLSSCASVAYDSLMLLAEGLSKTSGSSEEMKNFLYAVRDYPGVSGPITYDANGDLTRQHTIYVIKDGRLQALPQ